jgi:hypothetical protein
MKSFALLVALAFLTLAVPASAAENSVCAPVTTTLEQQTEGPVAPLEMIKPVLYCSNVHGTSCPSVGATKACTDICHSQLSCTCYNSPPNGLRWYCDQEC